MSKGAVAAMTEDEATARELLDAVDAKCQELLGEKARKERELNKAMRASDGSATEGS
jgi:hypothetical protein